MAETEPNTLAAEFKAQAHRMACGNRRSKSVRPVGNGMPIRKPAGAIRKTVTRAFTGSGHPAPNLLIGDATNASTDTAAATPIKTMRRRVVFDPLVETIRRL